MSAWEAFLSEHFPAYLLPETCRSGIPAEAAARFLARLSDRPQALALVRAASFLAGAVEDVHAFSTRQLPDLVRGLPSDTEVRRRTWEGSFQGRVDVAATLAAHLAGQESTFVTRSRKRRLDLPENLVVRAVACRILEVLRELRAAGIVDGSGWGELARGCEVPLRRAVEASALRDVSDARIDGSHVTAAAAARHPAYHLAARIHSRMTATLDSQDPEQVARMVGEGALVPILEWRRFEMAVLIKLVARLHAAVQAREPGRWRLDRPLVLANRDEVAELVRDDGARLTFHYDHACFAPGARERGLRHFLAYGQAMRPDITVTTRSPGRPPVATVVEVKHSSDPGYLRSGYEEALLYAYEYGPLLRTWPKAVLVTSSPIHGGVDRTHDVVAVDWARWVPEPVVEGLLEGV